MESHKIRGTTSYNKYKHRLYLPLAAKARPKHNFRELYRLSLKQKWNDVADYRTPILGEVKDTGESIMKFTVTNLHEKAQTSRWTYQAFHHLLAKRRYQLCYIDLINNQIVFRVNVNNRESNAIASCM